MYTTRKTHPTPRRLTRSIATPLCSVLFAVTATAQAPDDENAAVSLADARPRAIQQILTTAQGDNPILRANAIEAMQAVPDRVLPLAQLGLEDPAEPVRFVALITIGKLRIESLGAAAERMLDDPSGSVRAAAMFAARRCGRDVDISDLANLLSSPQPGVRANAALVLGMLGEPSAIPMLKAHVGERMGRLSPERQAVIRIQFAEAAAQLGDEDALTAVRAGLYSAFDEVRVLAIQMIGRLEDRGLDEPLLMMIKPKDDPRDVDPLEVRMAAMATLATSSNRIIIKETLEASDAVFTAARSDIVPARAQAAFTLGALEQARRRVLPQLIPSDPAAIRELFESRRYADRLVQLLDDPDEQVRLSASAAILRVLDNR